MDYNFPKVMTKHSAASLMGQSGFAEHGLQSYLLINNNRRPYIMCKCGQKFESLYIHETINLFIEHLFEMKELGRKVDVQ